MAKYSGVVKYLNQQLQRGGVRAKVMEVDCVESSDDRNCIQIDILKEREGSDRDATLTVSNELGKILGGVGIVAIGVRSDLTAFVDEDVDTVECDRMQYYLQGKEVQKEFSKLTGAAEAEEKRLSDIYLTSPPPPKAQDAYLVDYLNDELKKAGVKGEVVRVACLTSPINADGFTNSIQIDFIEREKDTFLTSRTLDKILNNLSINTRSQGGDFDVPVLSDADRYGHRTHIACTRVRYQQGVDGIKDAFAKLDAAARAAVKAESQVVPGTTLFRGEPKAGRETKATAASSESKRERKPPPSP